MTFLQGLTNQTSAHMVKYQKLDQILVLCVVLVRLVHPRIWILIHVTLLDSKTQMGSSPAIQSLQLEVFMPSMTQMGI